MFSKKNKDTVEAYRETYKRNMDALYRLGVIDMDEMEKMLKLNADLCNAITRYLQ